MGDEIEVKTAYEHGVGDGGSNKDGDGARASVMKLRMEVRETIVKREMAYRKITVKGEVAHRITKLLWWLWWWWWRKKRALKIDMEIKVVGNLKR